MTEDLEQQLRAKFGTFIDHGIEVQVNCPQCILRVGKQDTKFHLYINIKKGVFNCFRCGWKGRDLTSVGLLNSNYITVSSIKQLLPKELPKRLDMKEELRNAIAPETSLEVDLVTLPKYFSQDFTTLMGRAAYNYLISRQLTQEMIKQYKIGYCYKGKFAGFIILPVFDHGKLVYYVGRAIGSKMYKNASVSVSNVIFNYGNQGRKILCEGIFDALMFDHEGIAILGKFLKKGQLQKIITKPPKELFICLDTDAKNEAIYMAKQLKPYIPNVYIMTLGDHKDANSIPKKFIRSYIDKAIKYNSIIDLAKVKINA